MSEVKKPAHTPGPWHVAGTGIYSGTPDERGHYPRSEQVFPAYGGKTDAANARLIVAAPDLLAACRSLLAAFEERCKQSGERGYGLYMDQHEQAVRESAMTAIRKATGTT